MRALKILTVVMGVMIVAGVVALGVVLTQRLALAPGAVAASSVLDEPAGTRMAQISAAGDRVTVLLQGGGADRLVVLDVRTGAVVSRMQLGR
jgi:hypothetical protein